MKHILSIKERRSESGAYITLPAEVKQYETDGTISIEQDNDPVGFSGCEIILHQDDILAIADAIRSERVGA